MWTQHGAYRAGKEGYVSEFTQFMQQLLLHHPEIIEDQHRGWALYWEADGRADTDLGKVQKAQEANTSNSLQPRW